MNLMEAFYASVETLHGKEVADEWRTAKPSTRTVEPIEPDFDDEVSDFAADAAAADMVFGV